MDDYSMLTFWTLVAVCVILIARYVWKELKEQKHPTPPAKHLDIRGPLRRGFIYLINAGHGAGLP